MQTEVLIIGGGLAGCATAYYLASAGIEVMVVERDDLRQMAPYVSERMVGGAYCATEGKANPLKVTPAFARAALSHGARIATDMVVTGLAPEAGGYRAETDRGSIAARRVVNSAGA